MNELIAFLRARLKDEADEARAAHLEPRSLSEVDWHWETNQPGYRWQYGGRIARNKREATWLTVSPARLLAEVESKLAILKLHHLVPWSRVEQVPGTIVIDDPDNGRDFCDVCGTAHPCQTLRLLALPYADHPGYRQEWRP